MSDQRGRLFVVAAPSGGGKTSLTRALIERLAQNGIRAEFSISYTTRPPRPGEQDGVDYHFVSQERFAEMIERGEFLEHAQVFGQRYGTGREATQVLLQEGVHVFLDIDWQGARQVRDRADSVTSLFIRPPSLVELEQRLRERGQDDEATIRARMEEAHAELAHAEEFDHVIINDDFERALDELERLVLKQTGEE